MNSERLRMVTNRSHVGELFGFAMLAVVGVAWPLALLAGAFGGAQ